MKRTRIAVVFGGRSTEHAISCLSAASVVAALDPERYDVVPIGITPAGRWVLAGADIASLASSSASLPEVTTGQPIALTGDPTVGLMSLADAAVGPVDVVFPVLHGPFGEDGTVQGLLELAGVPYVGSGVLASAAAMDKAVARVLLTAAGIAMTPAVVVRGDGGYPDPVALEESVRGLGLPVFVKPCRGGSSIGISLVEDWKALPAAVQEALRFDPKVLVEAAVVGREVECGILEGVDGQPAASVPAEVRLVGTSAFYNFDAKYLDSATQLICPAELPAEVTERLQDLARRAFVALDCSGLARVDFFVGDNGEITLNEVNTMPGFTATSMFPRMWAATGLDYPGLVDRLVQTALRRGTGLR